MSEKRLGRQTVALAHPPSFIGWSSVVGKKEGDGPLGDRFDWVEQDDTLGESTWERSETALQKKALAGALEKAKLTPGELDYLFAGDLINQCAVSSFAARSQTVPYLGIYGACSTMGEALSLAAMVLDGGFARQAGVVTSSHFCTAERQYRTPLEYGSQRTPTAQWTVTAAGAAILSREGQGPFLTHVTTGMVTDKGITDANNMGAAMAPAAYATIKAHLEETGREPGFYDWILTGDLGTLGSELLRDLFRRDGVELPRYDDCGCLIFDPVSQDVHCGGSGCGCSAAVLTGHLLRGMTEGKWQNLLFCPTGALLSPTTTQQGESIPAICHAVSIAARLPEVR